MKSLRALTRIGAGHCEYQAGQIFHVDDEAAKQLLECGAAEVSVPRSARPLRLTLAIDWNGDQLPVVAIEAPPELPDPNALVWPPVGGYFNVPTRAYTPESHNLKDKHV